MSRSALSATHRCIADDSIKHCANYQVELSQSSGFYISNVIESLDEPCNAHNKILIVILITINLPSVTIYFHASLGAIPLAIPMLNSITRY